MTEFKVGQIVETSTGHQGLVQYVGTIHVAEGPWLGVQLEEPNGKNDGSVRGERYFTCPPAHGLFVKPSSIVQIISEPAPPAPRAAPKARSAAPATTTPATAAPRPRPSSVIAPKPAPRTATASKRQSVTPSTSYAPSRAPTRKPSIAGPSTATLSEPAESSRKPTASASRPSISSTTSNTTTSKTTRDGNVETLQTKIRHLEKQRSEDQEKLKELAQTKDERDRYRGIIEKLQTKGKEQFDHIKTLEQQLQTIQDENDTLNKSHEEFEIENEHALIDKEMAEERAEQAEAEAELLRKKVEERDLELDILREEAELYTAEMTEEEKQDAGFYRLQHENERLREALIGLKEMTEEKERDYKVTIASLESDLVRLESLESDNTTLQQRVIDAEALAEDLKQRLEAAEEADDMVEELSSQNQNLQDRVAEQDLIIQDLENLRELNDELEIQHIEQEEEMRAELEARDIELAEQTTTIARQTTMIEDQSSMLSKFRELVHDLQFQAENAEKSKILTEAQVKDTTGRFHEIMDLNRQLRTTTVQSTGREIDAALKNVENDEMAAKLQIWDATGSKDFIKSEALNSYLTAKRIAKKAGLLMNMLRQHDKQTGNVGRPEDVLACVNGTAATAHLAFLRDYSERLYNVIASAELEKFSVFGPLHQDLITIENTIIQGLQALKADSLNYDELAGSFGRSIKIYEAMLANHQAELDEHPEDEILLKARTVQTRMLRIEELCILVSGALEVVPENAIEPFATLQTQLNKPMEKVKSAVAAANRLLKTLYDLRKDSMHPKSGNVLIDNIVSQDEILNLFTEQFVVLARGIIEEVVKSLNPPTAEDGSPLVTELDYERYESARKLRISLLEEEHGGLWDDFSIEAMASDLRDVIDQVSILVHNIEIEQKPTPWAQKAKEVEALRRKDEEVAQRLKTLTAEHIATVLKINEREQVISTKELEIEHLMAKNRDAVTKMGDIEALQTELKERGDKIAALKAEQRALVQEMQTVRERRAQSDQSINDDGEAAPLKTINTVADAADTPSAPPAPFGMKILIEALQNENHWLRQREQKANLELNKKHMKFWLPDEYHQEPPRFTPAWKTACALIESTMFDSDGEDEALTPDESSSPASLMTPLALREVQLGWESRANSLKEALDLAEDTMLSTIWEEDKSSVFNIDV